MEQQNWKTKLKEYISTRAGLTNFSWVVGLILIVLVCVAVGPINKTCLLGALVFATFVLSICSLITIFSRYADSERFPVSAYFNIGMTLFFSISSIGLLAIDLGFTLLYKYHDNLLELNKHKVFITVLWNIIYWGSLINGTILSKFFSKYWQSGHFKVWGRIKHALKAIFILIIAGAIVGGILIVVIYTAAKYKDLSGVKAALLILSNFFNMFQLVGLLAYGLFNIPIFLWKYADKKQALYNELEIAETVRSEYRASLADYLMIVSQCRNLVENHRSSQNSEFMDILEEELPTHDLEGGLITYSSNFTYDLQSGQEVSEDYIATKRYQFKVIYFLYKRKTSSWMSLYNNVYELIQHPVEYTDEYLKKDVNELKLDEMIIKPKDNDKKEILKYRIFSIISLMFCLFILATETTVIVRPEYTLMYLTVGSFNYMVIIGEVQSGKETDPFRTCYVDFYSSMIRVPFLGSNFNTIMPLFILIMGLCFFFLSLFKLKNKTLSVIKKYTKTQEEKEIDEMKKDKKSKESEVDMNIAIQILKGEKAILSEFDLLKKKDERNKLLRFNNVQLQEIEMADNKKDGDKEKKDKSDEKKGKKLNQSKNDKLDTSKSGGKKDSSKKVVQIKDEKRTPLLSESSDPQTSQNTGNSYQRQKTTYGNLQRSVQPISGAKKMQYGIFKKARIMEEDEQDEKKDSSLSNDDDDDESNLTSNKKGKKEISNDQDMSVERKVTKKQTKNVKEEEKQSGKQTRNNFKKKPIKKRNDSEDEEDEDDYTQKKTTKQQQKKNFSKQKPKEKQQKKQKAIKKEGYLMKKKHHTIFTQWNKRYFVLENDTLTVYEDEKKQKAKKIIKMSQATAVNFHYDENAPVQSKKIRIKEKDESRFDIYTPIRKFMLRTEEENIWEAEEWVAQLQESIKRYNPKFFDKEENEEDED